MPQPVFLLSDKQTAVTREELINLHPNTYIPQFPTNGFITSLGCFPVIDRPYPEVGHGEIADIGPVQNNEGTFYRDWVIRPMTDKELQEAYPIVAPKLLSPRAIPRAFIGALGMDRGMTAWAEIRNSSHPTCVYWMSEYETGEEINPFDERLIGAIRLLLTINGSTGNPLLSETEPDSIISVLQTIS